MSNSVIISTLVNFLVVGLVFMVTLAITFKILLKKYTVDNSKIKFYGLFLGMNNYQILSFSMISINYLFLIYYLVSFNGLNIIYVLISFLLVILSDIIAKNYSKMVLNILYEIISLSTIYISSLLYNYLTEQKSIIINICLIFLIVLSALFYSYVLFKSLNNVIVKDKHIKENKYSI